MSIYATNYIIDEETGEPKLVKHLNQTRIDRGTTKRPPGKWNKNGANQKERKRWSKGDSKKEFKLDKMKKDFEGL